MSQNISIPIGNHFWITRARVPTAFLHDKVNAPLDNEGSALTDLEIKDGRIATIVPASDVSRGQTPVVTLGGCHLWPTLVDIHTHIDKSQVISRLGSLDGSFANARNAINADRIKYWTLADIRARMEFSIRCAHMHGVAALRTHIDSYEGQADASWSVFSQLRKEWSDRILLQATAAVPIDVYSTPYGRELADLAAATEGGLIGGVLRRSKEPEYTFIDNIDALLDEQFKLAKERGLAIDLHVDETTDRSVLHLEHVARAAIRHKMQGRVVCGHCCSLALQPDETIDRVLALCVEADIGIVTLPSTNCYLQDRQQGRTPRLRGIAPVHEIRAKKIPVAIASDNVRDSLYPFGDYDMVENFRQSVSVYHLDQNIGESLVMVGPMPGLMMGVSPVGSLTTGRSANLIIFNALNLREIVARPQMNRVVLLNGRHIKGTLPEFPDIAGSPFQK